MSRAHVPPHSIEAEQAVLGSVLTEPSAWSDVAYLGADDFYRSDHRALYATMAELAEAGETIDPVTVLDRLEAAGTDLEAGGLAYIVEIAENTPSAANAGAYASIVRERSNRRRAIARLAGTRDSLMNGFRGDLGPVVESLSADLRDLGSPGAGGPELETMADMLARPDEQMRYVVDGLLPAGGTSLLSGFAKSGKSTLVGSLVLAVARGSSFLGRDCMQGRVLYLAFEDHPQALRDRMLALGARADDPILSMTGYLPAEVDSLAWVRAAVEQHRPVLVVADTLVRMVAVDLNDYSAVAGALEPFFALARESGTHLLMLHHSRKDAGDFGLDVLGSQALPGSVDTVISLRREPGTGARYISSENRYGEAFEATLLEHDAQTGRVALGYRRADARLMRLGDDILGFLAAQSEPATLSEIEKSDDVTGRAADVRKCVQRLARTGRIVLSEGARRGSWRYSVPHVTGPAK